MDCPPPRAHAKMHSAMASRRKEIQISSAVRQRVIIGGGAALGVVLIVVLIVKLLTPSPERLLNAEPPLSDAQIRRLAADLLMHEDLSVRQRASEKLEGLGEPAIPVLSDVCLNHPDAKVRLAAVYILLAIDEEVGMEVLAQMMGDTDVQIRYAAVQAAMHSEHEMAYDIIEAALADENADVRLAAGEGASLRGMKGAVTRLEELLDHPDVTTRRHAARNLRRITGEDYRNEANLPEVPVRD